eukprot:s2144_g8.t1
MRLSQCSYILCRRFAFNFVSLMNTSTSSAQSDLPWDSEEIREVTNDSAIACGLAGLQPARPKRRDVRYVRYVCLGSLCTSVCILFICESSKELSSHPEFEPCTPRVAGMKGCWKRRLNMSVKISDPAIRCVQEPWHGAPCFFLNLRRMASRGLDTCGTLGVIVCLRVDNNHLEVLGPLGFLPSLERLQAKHNGLRALAHPISASPLLKTLELARATVAALPSSPSFNIFLTRGPWSRVIACIKRYAPSRIIYIILNRLQKAVSQKVVLSWLIFDILVSIGLLIFYLLFRDLAALGFFKSRKLWLLSVARLLLLLFGVSVVHKNGEAFFCTFLVNMVLFIAFLVPIERLVCDCRTGTWAQCHAAQSFTYPAPWCHGGQDGPRQPQKTGRIDILYVLRPPRSSSLLQEVARQEPSLRLPKRLLGKKALHQTGNQQKLVCGSGENGPLTMRLMPMDHLWLGLEFPAVDGNGPF